MTTHADYLEGLANMSAGSWSTDLERAERLREIAGVLRGVETALARELDYMIPYASPEARNASINAHPEKAAYYHGKFKGLKTGTLTTLGHSTLTEPTPPSTNGDGG